MPAVCAGSLIAMRAAPASSRPITRPTSSSRVDAAGGDEVEQLGVLVRGHPVRAEHLELLRDDEVHGQRRRRLVAEQQPDLHVPAAATQRAHRGDGGGGGADRVQRDVRAAAGGVAHGGCRVVGAHRRGGAQLDRPGERGLGHVHRHDLRAERRTDQHRGQPDASAPVHGQPVARAEPAVRDDGPVGGGQPAAERRRGDHVEVVRQAHQVRVRGAQRDELRERPGAGEARLGLVGADVRVTGPAVGAPSAAADERHRHPVADRPASYGRADGVHRARELVARHVRPRHRVVPGPGVPVGAADPGRADPHHDAVVRALGVRQVDQTRGGERFGVLHGAHPDSVPGRRRRAATRRLDQG